LFESLSRFRDHSGAGRRVAAWHNGIEAIARLVFPDRVGDAVQCEGTGSYVVAVFEATGDVVFVLTDFLGLSYSAPEECAKDVSGRLYVLERFSEWPQGLDLSSWRQLGTTG
jgi:hypothetical protein